MKYAGEREGVRRLAMKVLARAVTDGDLRFTFTGDFPMWCALAQDDEKRMRKKIFEGLLIKKKEIGNAFKIE